MHATPHSSRPFPSIPNTVVLFFFLLLLPILVATTESSSPSNYTNPVVPPTDNTPDPGVLTLHANPDDPSSPVVAYFSVTTSNYDGLHDNIFPIRRSANLVDWEVVGYIFPNVSTSLRFRGSGPTRPQWAVRDFWAPELHRVNGRFVAYFTARDEQGVLCIGVAQAVGNDPLGPYVDPLGEPLVRNQTGMGSIDATIMFDVEHQHRPYLVYKTDGNAIGAPTWILARELDPSGTSFVLGSSVVPLIRDSLSWEGGIVEGPWLIRRKDPVSSRMIYYLFYSANGYAAPAPSGQCLYAVGVARSLHGLLGPYEKYHMPILHHADDDSLTGPGHCSVVLSPDLSTWYMVYHAWITGHVGGLSPRLMSIDRIEWTTDAWPSILESKPSDSPQPFPPGSNA